MFSLSPLYSTDNQALWVAVLALSLASTGLSQTPAGTAVNLSSAYNRMGVVRDGFSFASGLDGYGNCYSTNLLGSAVAYNGASLTLGSANVPNAVSNATVALPAGQFATMTLLASGVNGNQASQSLRVNYTDGTNTSFAQNFSDWHTPQSYAGEGVAATMAYRDSGNGTVDNRMFDLYGYSLPLNAAKTVQSVTLPANSNVLVLAITLTAGTSPGAGAVNLSSVYNRLGMVRDGSLFTGGVDGYGFGYSANLLGSALVFNGTSLTLGPANVSNAVSSATVALQAGQFSTMTMLATAVNGNQASQNLKVTYTDGTSTSYVQSFSDWFSPQSYSGEGAAASMAYRDSGNGAQDRRTFLLYGYSFALNAAKTVQSLTLPANANVLVFAVTLAGSSIPPPMYTISGAVSGSAATLTVSGTMSESTSTNGSGNYTFSSLPNGSYVVAPSQSGFGFTPSTALITINSGSASGVNFTGTANPPPPSHSVSLTWNASTTQNISGYNVYRSAVSGGPYAKLNSSLLAATSVVDSNVVAGQTYFYVATTVQNANEGAYSNQAQAVVPTP